MKLYWGKLTVLSSSTIRRPLLGFFGKYGAYLLWFFAAFYVLTSTNVFAQKKNTDLRVFFNIPEKSVELALIEFAEQADLTLVVRFDDVSGKTANRLNGEYSLQKGIAILLDGTSLIPTFKNELVLNITTTVPTKKIEGSDMEGSAKKNVLASIIAFFAAQTASGEEGNNTLKITETETTGDDSVIEEIIVLGTFQRDIRNALEAKRQSTNISDGIFASDIGALPNLDLGEALQFVPGVQLNREAERRESSVNVRGLPSGFVLTTANGQSISNSTRSTSPFGAPNPFGAFDAAIFNGVQVFKSQSADMQEGGIAGVIDLGVGRALSGSESMLDVQVGYRLEDLANESDLEVVVSGAKHLFDGKVGLNGTVAYSDQSFRRDLIRVNRYTPLEPRFDEAAAGQTYEEWRVAQGVPDGAIVNMPGELRQVTEINSGSRLSFSGGIEVQATESLKLGANIIYSKRDMDDNGIEQADFRSRVGGALVTVNNAPRDTGAVTADGNPIWAVTDINVTNAQLGQDSREWDLYEQTQAIVLDAAWDTDVWDVNGALTVSESETRWDEVLLAYRLRANSGLAGGRLFTGEGNIEDFFLDINLAGALDLDSAIWPAVQTEVGNSSSITTADGKQWGVTGTYENIDRDLTSFEFNIERHFENSRITSLKFGYRFSNDEQDSIRFRNSTIGLDLVAAGINNSILTGPHYTTSTPFFNGEAPGYWSANDGWISWNPQAVSAALINTIDFSTLTPNSTTGELPVFTPRGFIARGGQQQTGLVYDTSLDTNALYTMADFEFSMGSVPVSGNFGARFVSSDLEAGAPYFEFADGDSDINNPERRVVEHDYQYVLPSLNIGWDLRDDLKLRFAFYQSIVRPNLRSAIPASFISVADDSRVDITLPGAQVDPFDANSYDLSLEWYNRVGSAITLAFYRKDIDEFFETISFCDQEIVNAAGYDVGVISDASGVCITDGNDGFSDPDLLLPGANVNITQLQNIDNKISVDGFELSIQQGLDFLPHPWSGLGGVVNYSRAEQDNSNIVRIPGVSKHTYNAIAYFELERFGIRIAYNYRSDYQVEAFGTFAGVENRDVKAAGRLDLTSYFNVTDQLSLSLKAYNLTEEIYKEFQEVEWQPRSTHFDGRIFVLSAKYSF